MVVVAHGDPFEGTPAEAVEKADPRAWRGPRQRGYPAFERLRTDAMGGDRLMRIEQRRV